MNKFDSTLKIYAPQRIEIYLYIEKKYIFTTEKLIAVWIEYLFPKGFWHLKVL